MIYNLLKRFGSILVVLGILFGVIYAASDQPLITAIIIAVSFMAGGFFFIGFGSLLESVNKIQTHLTGESTPKETFDKAKPIKKIPGVKD
ncbi:hypothetical protein [Paenibacillus sp.]|jgi:hypothetical protein|uniref:hypothetical protein n=1 Tax=Paenibacillus sp. TaxID=58172 RepID=UPI00281CA84E|nr:hypothetical protein [Paenibacillus sp.]MDR0270999.1 hypothetical protein [Paenibacillus sp.]